MAGGPSNFDAEIKKGMSGTKAKSSDGGVPTKAPKASGSFNDGKPPAVQGQSGASGGINGDPGAHMAAIHTHLAAIHQHIASISSGKGAGGDAPVNQGTMAQ